MHFVVLVHLLVLITGRQTGAAEAPGFYSVGYYDCLAVEEQHQLHVGALRVVLAPGQKPLRVTVDAMVPWKEPSTERRPHGDCTGAYKSDLLIEDARGELERAKVTQFAHISPLPEDHVDYEVLFAVPPSGTIILGGAPAAVGAQERRRLVAGVQSSLPPNWRVSHITALGSGVAAIAESGHRATAMTGFRARPPSVKKYAESRSRASVPA